MADNLRARVAKAVHTTICTDADPQALHRAALLVDAVMDALKPAAPIPPGAELLRVLDALGMSQIQLAHKIGLSTKHINQICSGKAALSYETAIKLENVTGVPASWWNAAEAAYRTALLRDVQETWRGPKVGDAP